MKDRAAKLPVRALELGRVPLASMARVGRCVVVYILAELLADGPDLFAHRRREHHHLLLVRGRAEDLLNVLAHVCGRGRGRARAVGVRFSRRDASFSHRVHSPRASSMRSHSSRTKCFSFSSLRSLLRSRPRMRPGVPTMTCGVAVLSVVLFAVMGTPERCVTALRVGRTASPSGRTSALAESYLRRRPRT